jgi:membrane protease YdiL (CAAX protease family)
VLAVYMVVVLSGGAILAPWAWWLGQATGWEWLMDQPFRRYLHRCLLVLALVGLVPLAWQLGIRRWEDLGWKDPVGAGWRRLAWGYGVGMAMVLAWTMVEVMMGGRVGRGGIGGIPMVGILVMAGITGMVVGVLEETWFRGVLLGGMRRGWGWPAGLWISSVLFGWVHFLSQPAAPAEVTAWSGWVALGHMLSGWMEAGRSSRMLPVLIMAGWVLGLAYWRTESLWLPVGLHAGWVTGIKWRGALTTQGQVTWMDSGTGWVWGMTLLAALGTWWIMGKPISWKVCRVAVRRRMGAGQWLRD